MLNREVVLLDVGWLGILRPGRVEVVGRVRPKRLAESICNRKRRSAGGWGRWAGGILVDRCRKGRAGGQALIERVSLKEAGDPVANANHGRRIDLIGKAQPRHDLLIVRV